MIFWVLFEQAGGCINILTDRYVNRAGIEASMFQSVNALFIMLLAPVFNWMWGSSLPARSSPARR